MGKLRGLSHLLVTVFLSVFGSFMVLPAITDVTMLALCPGQDECSLAIYLTGFQQAIIGLGTVVMSPLIGNLSDKHGRKSLLTVPMTLAIIPLVILAFSRTTNFFYAYYIIRTLTAMVAGGAMECLTLAYVADNIAERERASAFGILAGVRSAAWVCGTLAARFLSTSSTFQLAALVSMIATVYMRIFLEESLPYEQQASDNLTQPIFKHADDEPNLVDEEDGQIQKTTMQIQAFKNIPSLQDVLCLLKTSKTFSQAAVVSFFQSLADGGIEATLLYFLKARFQFSKNQFADLMLITGIAGTISQLLFMPLMATAIGEEKLLSIGLLVGSANMFIYSISWSAWVPYVVSLFSSVAIFSYPTVRSIASKQFGSNEQGKALGCISGISSFANIVSPLIFSSLTALFLSERAPINFPGFSIMCVGLALMIAFIQSTMITTAPGQRNGNNNCMEN
nr:hippocampus abundant transcript 1 protein-like isoform X1 [Ziziphus jujuba var. spinosa]